MKRILAVLLLTAVVSLGYSVTGSVYARLLSGAYGGAAYNGAAPGRYYYSEPWATTIQDLRVGRQGTGVTMNFDSFSLSYKLRDVISSSTPAWGGKDGFDLLIGNFGGIATQAASRSATSPGYLRIDGLKLGGIDLGVGGSFWTYGESIDNFSTNAAGNTTNAVKGTASYNNFALDLTYNIQVGDIRIHADPWNKTFFNFWSGSDTVNNIGTTNTGTVGGYNATISGNIDYSMEALSLTIECKAFLGGSSSLLVAGLTTNNNSASSSEIGAVLKAGYVVNELVSVFGDAGLVIYGGATSSISGVTTNTTATSGMQIPLLAGITLSPVSAFQVNLGVGYAMFMNYHVLSISGANTNDAYVDPRAQSTWDNYEMHGYHHPMIKFGADTKFASDFSAGLRFIVQMNDASGTGNNGGGIDQNTHNQLGYAKDSNWLNFNNIADWDGMGGASAYLGYEKDNFSTKLWVAGTGSLLGLFGAIDASIKF